MRTLQPRPSQPSPTKNARHRHHRHRHDTVTTVIATIATPRNADGKPPPRMGASAAAVDSFHRRRGMDWRIVLFQLAGKPSRPARAAARRGRRLVGGAWRRLLPPAKIRDRAGCVAAAVALVQVGSVYDLAQRLCAVGDGLLHERGRVFTRRGCGGRVERMARHRHRRRRVGGFMVGVRCIMPLAVAPRAVATRGRGVRMLDRAGVGVVGIAQRARCIHPHRRGHRFHHGRQCVVRDYPGAKQNGRGVDGRARGRPGARRGRVVALASQQLPHAAGVIHHGQRAFPRDLRPRMELGDTRGHRRGRLAGAALL